jgi:hypothetical protein
MLQVQGGLEKVQRAYTSYCLPPLNCIYSKWRKLVGSTSSLDCRAPRQVQSLHLRGNVLADDSLNTALFVGIMLRLLRATTHSSGLTTTRWRQSRRRNSVILWRCSFQRMHASLSVHRPHSHLIKFKPPAPAAYPILSSQTPPVIATNTEAIGGAASDLTEPALPHGLEASDVICTRRGRAFFDCGKFWEVPQYPQSEGTYVTAFTCSLYEPL